MPFHGATASSPGAGRRAPNEGKKKRRRSRRRKKNPTPVTWILIAGGAAAAVGGGIAYALYRKKKGSQPPVLPPTNGGGTRPGGGGGRPSGGGGKVNAPAFPYSQSEAEALEVTWVPAVVAEAMPASGGQITKSKDAIADAAFYEMYKISKIPGNRGTGWDPYIASWMRIRGLVSTQVDAYNSAAIS